jgi:hypothetical protein
MASLILTLASAGASGRAGGIRVVCCSGAQVLDDVAE